MGALKYHLNWVEKTDATKVIVVLLCSFLGLFSKSASYFVNFFYELPVYRG